ncbi:MAG: AAA family ATPase [Acidobacteriota bacterium]|nr:AAA family ATPase [Acidobacteriota bacterium]
MKRPVPIDISNFRKLREGNFYYVDKSLLVADVVRSGAEVILLPRPRRFGKTINLSMLHHFFDRSSEDSASLFHGLAVSRQADIMAHCGQYPTVFLSFKDVKVTDFETCYDRLASSLARLYRQHEETIAQADPRGLDKRMVEDILNGTAKTAHLQDALSLLTELLYRACGKKVMVLIDEYDTPIYAGYRYNYYDEIVAFMRDLLCGALKDNDYLQKGVMTGILRIAKESIFSGLNNLDVHTLLDEPYAQHFGFTSNEVAEVLHDAGLDDRLEEVKNWYNGYRFGSHTIYNPWSIMNLAANPGAACRPYWVNTSDNQLIHDLVTGNNAIPREALETLMQDETVEEVLETNMVLNRLNSRSIWAMLTFSGYLKPTETTIANGRFVCKLTIPNLEVRNFYEDTVTGWIEEQVGSMGLKPLTEALLAEDIPRLSDLFGNMVKGVLSYHDTGGEEPERVYHPFLLGMLIALRENYRVQSNRESGHGRYDVLVTPEDKTKTGFIFEFKTCGDKTPEEAASAALQQIQTQGYAHELWEAGLKKARAIAVAVSGKRTYLNSVVLKP